MNYNEEIKIFRIKDNINLPLASNPNKITNSSIGDLLVCWDNKNVYVKNWDNPNDASFSLLLNNLAFIEANEHFFENISGNSINHDTQK